MKAIVCADINWGIGKGTGMLFHIPADLKFFKEKTMGSTVIMGRTTSLPAGAEGSAGQEEYSADARRKLERRECHGVPRH